MAPIDYTHVFEDSLNEIYVFHEETLRFIEVNRGARENLGYTIDELHQITPLDIKREFNLQQFEKLIAPLRNHEQEKIVFETTHYRKDGSSYPTEVHLHLSETSEDKVFVAIILDITERIKVHQQALQLAIEQERVKLLRDFIDDVSHDLRTPLTQAGTSLYLLEQKLKDASNKKYTRQMHRALDHLETMIDKLLQMREVDLKDNYDKTPININQLLTIIVNSNLEIARQRDLTLNFNPPVEPQLFAPADAHYLTRAIENIISNALRHTPSGGTITIQTAKKTNHICISISDTGYGIAPEHIPHIFERFYRTDSARNTNHGNNGMGLAIAKKIVAKHDGHINVESQLGKGSTFTIEIPAAPDPA